MARRWHGRERRRRKLISLWKRAMRYTPIQEALDAGDVSKVGDYVNFPVYFDLIRLDFQQTQVFPSLPKSGRELLESKYYSDPMEVGCGGYS